MKTSRLEAFSDGVLAIALTIMVLELKVPHNEFTFEALGEALPTLLAYVLSFIYIGIYWNNHHHLFHAVQRVSGGILWANLHLLFWLSLIPFATAWMGESEFARDPVLVYGAVLMAAGIAYWILTIAIVRDHGRDSAFARAIGKDFKGKLSVVLYLVALAAAFANPLAACGLFGLVAVMWLIPDRRMERAMQDAIEECDKAK